MKVGCDKLCYVAVFMLLCSGFMGRDAWLFLN